VLLQQLYNRESNMAISKKQLKIIGMQCTGCEDVICEAIKALPGVQAVSASYTQATMQIQFDDKQLDDDGIQQCLEAKGYSIEKDKSPTLSWLKHGLIFLLLLLVVGGVAFWGKSLMPNVMQQIGPHMDHLMLLGIGFLTGFHCIGMCGAFVVGYTNPQQSKARQLLGHLIYGFGKTFSYSALGAGFGLLGAAIAITPQIRGVVALASSVFLLLYGLKMLNVFSVLRRFTLRLPSSANREIASQLRKHRSPLMTGLLTGLLLGCGPLQAMYVMAAGSGDPVQGATILMLFSLGTLGPLLTFGLFASLLPQGVMRYLLKVSGILVFAMGLMMAQRGWSYLHMAPGAAMPAQMMHGH
jgi:sulfite exporter TauE/SafE/copper chaperone CopZ